MYVYTVVLRATLLIYHVSMTGIFLFSFCIINTGFEHKVAFVNT